MREIKLNPKVDRLKEMTALYGVFDLDVNTCRPTPQWEKRNLHSMRLPFAMCSAYFPEFWIKRVLVNRRAAGPLGNVFGELASRYTLEALHKHGLDQFFRCYCFGDAAPSLFWYGAAWELSPKVEQETLAEVMKIFSRHGWTWCGLDDKTRTREFELW